MGRWKSSGRMNYDSHIPMTGFQRIPRQTMKCLLCLGCLLGLTAAMGYGQQAPPQTDSSYFDEHGTAHITRVVPVPQTISPEAQAHLARRVSDAAAPETLAERRSKTDAWQMGAGEKSRAVYPVSCALDCEQSTLKISREVHL